MVYLRYLLSIQPSRPQGGRPSVAASAYHRARVLQPPQWVGLRVGFGAFDALVRAFGYPTIDEGRQIIHQVPRVPERPRLPCASGARSGSPSERVASLEEVTRYGTEEEGREGATGLGQTEGVERPPRHLLLTCEISLSLHRSPLGVSIHTPTHHFHYVWCLPYLFVPVYSFPEILSLALWRTTYACTSSPDIFLHSSSHLLGRLS